jgi:hypothetical protein
MRTIGWPLCSYSLGRRKRRSRGAADSTKESIGRNDFLLHQSSMRRGFLRSLLPHPSGRTKVRLNLMTRKTPCSHHRRREAAINQRSTRRFAPAPFWRTVSLMLAREPCSSPPAAEFRLVPRRGSSAKSTVCGLNRLLPMLRIGTLYLNPRPRSALLHLRLFAPCWKRKLTVPFRKEKLRLAHFFSPKRNPKIPGEKERRKANG